MEQNKQECPFCCEEIDINAVKCPECGEALIKACPYCGETIKAIAIKCRHCGAMLDGSADVQTEKRNIIDVKSIKKEEYLCDFCKQIVPVDAKKCPHCGEWLEDEPQEVSCGMGMKNGVVVFINILSIFVATIYAGIGRLSMDNDSSGGIILFGVLGYIATFICAYIYLLPSIFAAARNHPQFWPIFIVNFIFGETIIGWVGPLIWATTHRQGRHTHW